MSTNQFADVSKNLCAQIKAIEILLKQNLFHEAGVLLPQATKCYRTLESLMIADNKIQNHILANRQKEIAWIQDAIQSNVKATRSKSVKSCNVKKHN